MTTEPATPQDESGAGGETAAHLAGERAAQRSEELTRFRERLATGEPVTRADVETSHTREAEARDRAVEAHLRAERAHERSARLHRDAADLATAAGDAATAARHREAAESDLRNAEVDRENAERDRAHGGSPEGGGTA